MEGLSLSLNQPFGINMNISYETLMNATLYELIHFLDIRDKYLEKLRLEERK
ncbi:hypothetical protein FUSO7_01030 [Fusobacterium necrophorum BFTR-2]|nr:hypothetical protein FUSO7_01030 [Fusobacterium necrophorum BFTR-2]